MYTVLALPVLQNRLHVAAVLHLYLKHLPMRVIYALRCQSIGEKSRCVNLISHNQITVVI